MEQMVLDIRQHTVNSENNCFHTNRQCWLTVQVCRLGIYPGWCNNYLLIHQDPKLAAKQSKCGGHFRIEERHEERTELGPN